ncbi:MAG: CYTH domain-containing protein [Anaerolineae bacterium]|nr:CYTH domain-containing protein [Anaerolineae bacterium]
MTLEIEAKLTIPDQATFNRLLAIPALGAYMLGPVQMTSVVDCFYDTVDMAMLYRGYACRLRHEGSRVIAAMKEVGRAADGIHRREELEVATPEGADPSTWPESQARALALALTRGRPLITLFELHQRRHRRAVRQALRSVGQLSLDEVAVFLEERTLSWLELEIELTGGEVSDLLTLSDLLQQAFGLCPQPKSKFARALEWRRQVLVPTLDVLPIQPLERGDISPAGWWSESSPP